MDVNHTLYFGTGTFTKPDLHSGVLCKVIDINPLILKNASGAPRSPVNNCGDVSWDDADVVKVLRDAVRGQSPKANHQEIARNREKSRNDAPSARLTPAERTRIPQIRLELEQQGIIAERWELGALTRGARVIFGDKEISYPVLQGWQGFSD
jgi:hypothetical protein